MKATQHRCITSDVPGVSQRQLKGYGTARGKYSSEETCSVLSLICRLSHQRTIEEMSTASDSGKSETQRCRVKDGSSLVGSLLHIKWVMSTHRG